MPRTSKKLATQSIIKSHTIFVEDTHAVFTNCCNLFNTLISGRVAASIRGLSHHILTPIQGAIADIDELETLSANNATFSRLKRNITNIYNTSKKIQLLLAEQSEFNIAKIRRVTLHYEINRIIGQLDVEANKRGVFFEHKFNNICETIEAIPDQIYIVLQNLLENAVKYSYDGFPDKPNKIRIIYKPFERTSIEIVPKSCNYVTIFCGNVNINSIIRCLY